MKKFVATIEISQKDLGLSSTEECLRYIDNLCREGFLKLSIDNFKIVDEMSTIYPEDRDGVEL